VEGGRRKGGYEREKEERGEIEREEYTPTKSRDVQKVMISDVQAK